MGYNIQETKKIMESLLGFNKRIKGHYDVSLSAKCHNGIFVGKKVKQNVLAFKGIPFAKPPVGKLRWKKPESADADERVYEAHYFGASAIQTEIPSERGSWYKKSEDCLYLNVWKNTDNTQAKKPVMVFIHGGSYGWGSTSDPLYDGANFVQKFDDIILVTIAYRIGILGFMNFSTVPGGEDYEDATNLGILDQIMALKWIQRNITAFGGDPNNVTIFGESAGGGSVSILPLLPQARGLFHKVIAESGSVALTYGKEESKRLTDRLLRESGIFDMKGLCALSEHKLKKLNQALNDYNNFPIRDGRILPEDLYGAYEAGSGAHIPMLIGTNKDECRYWIRELKGETAYTLAIPVLFENNLMVFDEIDKDRAKAFVENQHLSTTWSITEFYNELLFRVPAIAQASFHASCGGDTYMYYWAYPSAHGNLGACHAVELAYVFNNLNQTIYCGNNVDPDLADTVQQMWVNFARTGNPSTKKYKWPKYDFNRPTLILDKEISVTYDLLSQQRQDIEPLLKYLLNGCYTDLKFRIPYVRKSVSKLALGAAGAGLLAFILYKIFKKKS